MNEEQIKEMCNDIYTGGDWKPMIDYITNLQKENKHLSKSYAEAILFNQKRCEQNKELQQRIDNAIEWIKEHIATYQKNDIAILDWDTFADPRNLLKILGGDDE